MSKNPVIKKAREEGYKAGFENGRKFGFKQGQYSACMHLADKFDGLDKVPGIGAKTIEKIVQHFGAEYFKEVAQKDEE